MGLRVELGEGQPSRELAHGLRGPACRVDLVAAEPFVDVGDEARLAIFAVVDDVDAELGLPAHDLAHRIA